jgi:hypothetical protein
LLAMIFAESGSVVEREAAALSIPKTLFILFVYYHKTAV